MITIKVKEKDNLVACDIDSLEAEIDSNLKQVNIYYRNEFLGKYEAVYGIDEDLFINLIRKRGN